MGELTSILKIIDFGHRKLSREVQVRALLKVDEEKLLRCLEYYEQNQEFTICEMLKAVLDVKKFDLNTALNRSD